MVMVTTIRTGHSFPPVVLRVGTRHDISAEELHREPVEYLVATDGYLQAAVCAADLCLQVEQPRSVAPAHHENVVKSQDQTSALRALHRRTSMRHGPNLHGHGGQGPLAQPERFQDPTTLRRAPSPAQDCTTTPSPKTACRGET